MSTGKGGKAITFPSRDIRYPSTATDSELQEEQRRQADKYAAFLLTEKGKGLGRRASSTGALQRDKGKDKGNKGKGGRWWDDWSKGGGQGSKEGARMQHERDKI